MTRIDFYTKIDDKLRFACRLCAKALSQRMRVSVYAPDPALSERFDRLLWTDNAISFLPHCYAEDALAPDTPVLIHTRDDLLLHDDLLINLDANWPPFFSRFQRMIEIVSLAEEDASAARSRFRFYRDRGYALKTHAMDGAHE